MTVFSTVVLCVLILLVQSLRLVDLIVNRGVSLGHFSYMTMLLTPRCLAIVVPIAVFAATLFTYNRLISDSEIVVMRSAGLSQWALARPGLLVATECPALLHSQPLAYPPFVQELPRSLRADTVEYFGRLPARGTIHHDRR